MSDAFLGTSPVSRRLACCSYNVAESGAAFCHEDRDTPDRVRRDKIGDGGAVTLRVNGRLHHIGIGRTHARTPVILLIQDLHVRIIAATGELLREFTIDPDATTSPPTTTRTTPTGNNNSRTRATQGRPSPMS